MTVNFICDDIKQYHYILILKIYCVHLFTLFRYIAMDEYNFQDIYILAERVSQNTFYLDKISKAGKIYAKSNSSINLKLTNVLRI